MKVLIIQPWIRLGGAELISVHLADRLHHQGHKVAIACTFLDLTGTPDQARVVKYLLPPGWLSRLLARNRLAFLILGPWILFALVWRYSQDVDVLNPHNFPSAWVAALVGSLRGIPVVWTCNEPPERLHWREALKVGVGDYLGWLIASSWMDKFFVNRLAAIYVPSEKTRQQVRERYGRDATVIRIGIDVKFFEGGHDTILAGELGIENRFVLLTVGKLHPQKNQIVCIEAMSRVLQYIPNVVLVLAGEGPMMQEWKEIAERLGVSQNVLFLGQVNSLKIRDLYKVCDVNLFLPINQSWGFTPFEALCADKISIVSDDCGASEVLSKEEIGLVCQPTSEDLAENILKVHEKSAFYKEAATRGYRYVSKHLTWERYSEAFLMVVRKVTEPSQRIVVEEGAGGERIP